MDPTGAQEMLISVCSVQTCQEQSIFVGQRAVREQSESTQSFEIRVIQSEPKILRLVYCEVYSITLKFK